MVTPDQVGERYLAVHHRMFRAVNDEMSGCGLSMARTKVLLRLLDGLDAAAQQLIAAPAVSTAPAATAVPA